MEKRTNTERLSMIVLTGPTAVGKTGLSIALARAVGGEIISADSMQVYRHMDIGSAKITGEQMQGIRHHMIDILEPWEPFSAALFREKCARIAEEIHGRGRIPIVVGGTGFYIQALLRDIDFSGGGDSEAAQDTSPGEDGFEAAPGALQNTPGGFGTVQDTSPGEDGFEAAPGILPDISDRFGESAAFSVSSCAGGARESSGEYRRYLEALAKEKGVLYLHEMLRQVDPASAQAIHPNNRKRAVRALEFYHLTGQRISEHNERERQKGSAYRSCYFVLNDERERLYARIEQRVDEMLAAGLAEEVTALRAMGCHRGMVSMQGLGYKEILAWLEGECTYEQAVERLKRNTRHFAKRQLTWFRREREVIWINKDEFGYDEEKILAFILAKLKEKGVWDS